MFDVVSLWGLFSRVSHGSGVLARVSCLGCPWCLVSVPHVLSLFFCLRCDCLPVLISFTWFLLTFHSLCVFFVTSLCSFFFPASFLFVAYCYLQHIWIWPRSDPHLTWQPVKFFFGPLKNETHYTWTCCICSLGQTPCFLELFGAGPCHLLFNSNWLQELHHNPPARKTLAHWKTCSIKLIHIWSSSLSKKRGPIRLV